MTRWILLELAMMVAALAFAATAAGMSPLSSYAWAQPGAAPVTTPLAEPSAWIVSFTTPAVDAVALNAGYVWAQPGAAPASTPLVVAIH